jgi:hypothetical protein
MSGIFLEHGKILFLKTPGVNNMYFLKLQNRRSIILRRKLMKIFPRIIVFSLLIRTMVPLSFAQSLPGTTGYFNIPSADFFPDKQIFIGSNLLNKEYKKWGNPDYHAMNFFVTTTFIPRLEVSLRYTRLIDMPSDLYQSTVGDRMASVKFQPLYESRYFPSVVVGLQNFFTTLNSGSASHFNSSYVVMSKNIKPGILLGNIGITVGYGAELFTSSNYQFIGLFYGLTISPKNMEFLELMIENDADKWNAGMRLTILKHIVLLAGMEGLDAFSGGLSVKFQLP